MENVSQRSGTSDRERDSHPLRCLFPKDFYPSRPRKRFSKLQFVQDNLQDFKFELFPLHSPLLGESLLVSFPPLIDMLKFSGFSCPISDQVLEGSLHGGILRLPRNGLFGSLSRGFLSTEQRVVSKPKFLLLLCKVRLQRKEPGSSALPIGFGRVSLQTERQRIQSPPCSTCSPSETHQLGENCY